MWYSDSVKMSLIWQSDHQCFFKRAGKEKTKILKRKKKKKRCILFKNLRDYFSGKIILLIKQTFGLFYLQDQSLVEQALVLSLGAEGHGGRWKRRGG